MGRSHHPFTVVIPARYGSTRLPGKPLRALLGKPMIQHVYQRAVASGASRVLVATDHDQIEATVEGFGGECIRTSPDHASGTDRIAEVARTLRLDGETLLVNLQGDEPCVPSALVSRVAQRLAASPNAGISTLATPIHDAHSLFDPNVVKVVVDERGGALYFSRAPIPWVRDAFVGGQPDTLPAELVHLRHVGMYGYRVRDLLRIAAAPQAAFEKAESLEQLRALAMGIRIEVEVIDEAPGHGVDSESDIARVEAALRAERG